MKISKKVMAVLEADDFRCHYCRKEVDDAAMTIDHKTPKVRGGDDDIGNLVFACKSCNSSKGDRNYEEFMEIKEWKPQLTEVSATGTFNRGVARLVFPITREAWEVVQRVVEEHMPGGRFKGSLVSKGNGRGDGDLGW